MTRRTAWSSITWLCSLVLPTLGACYSADHPADAIEPTASPLDVSPFVRDGGARARDCPQASALSALDVRVRTTNAGGRFAPRNVGAIWVEDSSGAFVKTLTRWGKLRAKWLQRFNAASMGDVTDAVTSATLSMHQTHEITWDLSGLSGCQIEDGDYVLLFELTDRNGLGASTSIPFTKQQAGFSLMPNDTPSFHDLSVVLR